MEENVTTEQTTDELYNSVMAPKETDIPMSAQAPVEAAPSTHEITVNGKQIAATVDQLKQWASQGHDYSQKMESFKAQQEEFNSKYKSLSEIDEFAKQNPDWFDHVQDAYNSRDQQAQQAAQEDTAGDPEITAIKETLGDLANFKQEFIASQNRIQREDEDKLLDLEIKSIKDQYKNEDWNTPDENGHTLESRILQHATKIGVDKFSVAFRDHMHDSLITKAREAGKSALGEDLAKKTKLGLLGISSTPTKGLTGAGNVKSKSYDDLLAEAKEEFGIS